MPANRKLTALIPTTYHNPKWKEVITMGKWIGRMAIAIPCLGWSFLGLFTQNPHYGVADIVGSLGGLVLMVGLLRLT